MEIRTGCVAVKRMRGDCLAINEVQQIPLRLARQLAVYGDRAVADDFNGDGRAELVTGSLQDGVLYARRVAGPSFALEKEAHETWKSVSALTPYGLPGGELMACGFKEPSPEQLPPKSTSCELINVDSDLKMDHVPALKYAGQVGSFDLAPIVLRGGRLGIVCGLAEGENNRDFRLYVRTGPGADSPFERLAEDAARSTPLGSDVVSVAPCDSNRDGVDDLLFLGLSHAGSCRYGAAMVRLEGNDAFVPKRLAKDSIGVTHVAAGWMDDGHCYLLAASHEHGPQSVTSAAQPGLRVWPVDSLVEDASPETTDFLPGDFRAVTFGNIAGGPVFATASRRSDPVLAGGEQTMVTSLVLHVLSVDNGRIVTLWRSVLRNIGEDEALWPSLTIADINDDGREELVVMLVKMGTLIYDQGP